jgi:hypothetical protein
MNLHIGGIQIIGGRTMVHHRTVHIVIHTIIMVVAMVITTQDHMCEVVSEAMVVEAKDKIIKNYYWDLFLFLVVINPMTLIQ